MPPAPGHRKARTGCARCKRRKVKCDETKPKCSDCKRHNASCIYNQSVTQSRQQLEPTLSTTNLSSLSNERRLDAPVTDAALELRLMHEWTAFVCHSISTDWEYWYYKAPIVAFKFRHVMDAILSLTALYASRQPLQKTVNVRGHVVPIHQSRHENEEQMTLSRMWIQHPYRTRQSRDPVHSQDVINDTGDISRHDSTKMLATSRTYFDRAIEGHRRSLDDLNLENIEAAFVTSILVSFIALFTFHEPEEESSLLPPLDPILWVQLSGGTRMVCRRWAELSGVMWMVQSGAFYGEPDLSDEDELFREQHAEPFWKLLTYAQEYENMSNSDRDIYQQSLSYIGLMYKRILEGSEPPLASCRRFIALPARLPDSFNQRLEQKQPRATVILAYAFAVISFIGPDVPWFEGIAQAQIPKMNSDLPSGWQTMMKWPMAVAAGQLSKENADYHLRETLGDMHGQ